MEEMEKFIMKLIEGNEYCVHDAGFVAEELTDHFMKFNQWCVENIVYSKGSGYVIVEPDTMPDIETNQTFDTQEEVYKFWKDNVLK